ncbi:protein RIK isoform X2 [Eutrema salsugineum]|uniref:protein RIK isoform X2 n=1 Tax=Eutrema salsugineum TaxID=72664 RepID=UPI000CECE455|nr:protein RIK isoform X2 [Eutrema salsugineum]
MTGDRLEARLSPTDEATANDASRTRQRRKRKWDQPAEQLVAAGVALPRLLPLSNVPAISCLNNTVSASVAPFFQTLSSLPQQTTSVPQVNQPKIQDELTIAREIVINDAEASLRHKLTKRSTQEEIQRSTGAVVITRGKYRLPSAPPDGEKPLYLHISAAAHLKETAERILAVDRAAAMIEEMMKQKTNSQAGLVGFQTVKMLSTCVYLGFEADPSSNVAARIRGPNDQYINHIMNETGATVVLRGRGSGSLENQHSEEALQPLHLLLSSSNPKSIDDAKRLAENLMDTISVEFGASRVSSSKVYGAVPPPQQLLSGAPSADNEQKPSLSSTYGLMTSLPIISPPNAVNPFSVPPATTLYPQFPVLQPPVISNGGHLRPSPVNYLQPVAGGTSYSGYAGIYPQATPLQQVAQVLKQSISPVISTVPPTLLTATSLSKPSDISNKEKDRRPPQKRKFQELPADSKVPAKAKQLEIAMAGEVTQKNSIVEPSANGVRSLPSPRSVMPPPPPKIIPTSSRSMLPPPPRFAPSTQPPRLQEDCITVKKPNPVPDTLVKLMEYGDDEEDDDDPDETLIIRS